MRIFIHGFKSLVRRPAKTAMLFSILFVVFNLIFIGFIIQNSIDKSKDYIREQIGSAVEYRMDYTAAMGGRNNNMSLAPLSLQVAEKIASNPYVASYFVTESANVNSDTIEPAETQETSGGFQRSFSSFTFSGSNTTEFLDFVMGNVKLVEGEMPSEGNVSNGDNVVLISQEVASTNNLRIGDTISLTAVSQRQARPGTQNPSNITTGKAAVYDVIGIYSVLNNEFNVNTIFTSNNVIKSLNGTGSSDDTNASIIYLLDSPNNVEAFKREASPYLTSEYHTLYSNDDEYESLTKPLNLISFIASILIWVVFIAGAAIILAIVTIFVRDRKFEIGLLLSSGEARTKIIFQFIFEMLVIAVIAFGISVGSSNIASKSVSGWIVENQLLSQTSLIGSTTSTFPANFQFGNNGRRASTSVYGDVDMQNVAEEFDVSLSAAVMLQLLFVSIILVLIGSSIPLTVILGYKPKRILQDY